MSNSVQQPRFDLAEEIRIVPPVAFVIAAIAFGCIQWVFHFLMLTHERNPPPFAFRLFMGLFIGVLVATVVVLIGYVNADSARRGMNRVLWTLLVIFIPNALGFILYFFVRQPLRTPCPKCGGVVQPGFHYCPNCQFRLVPTCLSCGFALQPEFRCCPGCGKPVGVNA